MAQIQIRLTLIHQTLRFPPPLHLQQGFLHISPGHSVVLFSGTWEFCASISNYEPDTLVLLPCHMSANFYFYVIYHFMCM